MEYFLKEMGNFAGLLPLLYTLKKIYNRAVELRANSYFLLIFLITKKTVLIEDN